MFIKKGKNKIIFLAAIALSGVFGLWQNYVYAASLQITSSASALAPGDTATLWVAVNTEGVAINNAEATIQYPADLVDVLSVSRGSSIFSLWVEEPAFSNSTGIVSFNGGVPTPGYTGARGNIISLTVRAKKAGQASFVYSGAAVRANDGLGTNVLTGQSGVILNIAAKEKKPEAPVVKEEKPVSQAPKEDLPALIKISSPTHPNQELWYKATEAVFEWAVPSGADAIQTGIDNNDSGKPRVTYIPPVSGKTVKDLADGVWYFKLRARKNSVWGPVSTYLARVDTVPPEKKNVSFSYDENSGTLNIAADILDRTSGIDYYEIYLNDVLAKKVPAKEFVDGKFSLAFDSPGQNNVRLVAVDRAGNSTDAAGTFESTGLPAPRLEQIPPEIPAGEQLLVRGLTQLPDTDITVSVKREDGEAVLIKTKSNSDRAFFVFTPALQKGNYEIWAQNGSGTLGISSKHIFTKAAGRYLMIIGPYTLSVLPLAVSVAILLAISMLIAFYLGQRSGGSRHHQKMKAALDRQDYINTLSLLKSRLERHLSIIQNTRRKRILTAEYKKIKQEIENDLDDIDRELQEQI